MVFLLHITLFCAVLSSKTDAAVAAATSGTNDHKQNGNVEAGTQEFRPPKLSFSSSSAAVAELTSLSSVEVPWKVFQSVSRTSKSTNDSGGDGDINGESAESVKRRAGPLLTLLDGGGIGVVASDGDAASSARAPLRAGHEVLPPAEQRAYLARRGDECYGSKSDGRDNDGGTTNAVAGRYDLLAESPATAPLASELWKYCALYAEGGVYVDAESAPLVALGDMLRWKKSSGREGGNAAAAPNNKNYAVVSSSVDSGVSLNVVGAPSSTAGTESGEVATGALLAIPKKHHAVPKRMIALLVETNIETLRGDALYLPEALIRLIREEQTSKDTGNDDWSLFEQRCQGIEVAGGGGNSESVYGDSQRLLRHCPANNGYCCEVYDPNRVFVILLTRHPLLPNQILPHHSSLPQPYRTHYGNGGGNTKNADKDAAVALDARASAELPFVSTLRDEETPKAAPGNAQTVPNAYETLQSRGVLPLTKECMDCIRDKEGANCDSCRKECPEYCRALCSFEVPDKPVSRILRVTNPPYKKDPERLIPRIVHQTWFEPVTAEKYPNMARLIESWKRSGWDYRFFDDTTAATFISTHFPHEVREAYDSIIPGAFKADLFRYCVLLIEGGIYADMDVMLESNLDAAVPADIGFMVPVDEPGHKPDFRMCLWNGFIAAAPGHPFLAQAIENVVNNIRNRFTVLDYDHMMCPSPELSVPHAFSTLFTAGPCILGLSLNEVLGRDLQTTFEPGDLKESDGGQKQNLPGRTIILHQNKLDMGAHRFTWLENNLVVAATDMPDYDDRKELESKDEEKPNHYSKTQTRTELYGLDKVYVNRNISHERILIKTKN